jgi:hypothetical protein
MPLREIFVTITTMQFNLDKSKNTIYFSVSNVSQNQFKDFLRHFHGIKLPLDKSN